MLQNFHTKQMVDNMRNGYFTPLQCDSCLRYAYQCPFCLLSFPKIGFHYCSSRQFMSVLASKLGVEEQHPDSDNHDKCGDVWLSVPEDTLNHIPIGHPARRFIDFEFLW